MVRLAMDIFRMDHIHKSTNIFALIDNTKGLDLRQQNEVLYMAGN